METLILVVYSIIALFAMGVVSHFVLDGQSGVWMGALGVLLSIGLGYAWVFVLAALAAYLLISALVRWGRHIGHWIDVEFMGWIA